ncbi:MAG: sulfite exporter TauE/SafE family protein [Rhodobacteraceae bacterium]|nr:sulfite exporter TauE/SafE family protein [Paracoccaceae bacterium]
MVDSLVSAVTAIGLETVGNLVWLIFGACLAGLVRGFSGFGTAMVYLPFAASVMPPVWAVTSLVVMDFIAPLMIAHRTARDSDLGDVVRLGVGCLAGLPLGVTILMIFSADAFRYAVSALSILLLVLLWSGLRFRGNLTRPMVYGTGALSGVLGGAVGIPGPPVIFLYLASSLPASAIRANNFLFLLLADVLLLTVLFIQGMLFWAPLLIGICMTVPYLAFILIGAAMFNPAKEKSYRHVAYAIIAASALKGLPDFAA